MIQRNKKNDHLSNETLIVQRRNDEFRRSIEPELYSCNIDYNRDDYLLNSNYYMRFNCENFGMIVFTQSIYSASKPAIEHVLTLIKNYDDFTDDSDPYNEHDFVVLNEKNTGDFNAKIYGKIDYFDVDYKLHTDDKTDAKKTKLLLTVMLASEY